MIDMSMNYGNGTQVLFREKGSDPSLGRKLYQMFIQQGLDPKVDVYSLPITKFNDQNGILSSTYLTS